MLDYALQYMIFYQYQMELFIHVRMVLIYPIVKGIMNFQFLIPLIVKFRLIVFRPYIGEILEGKIVSSCPDSIRGYSFHFFNIKTLSF